MARAHTVTAAAMTRAAIALKRAGMEVKGVRLHPDGRADLLTADLELTPDEALRQELRDWQKDHGEG